MPTDVGTAYVVERAGASIDLRPLDPVGELLPWDLELALVAPGAQVPFDRGLTSLDASALRVLVERGELEILHFDPQSLPIFTRAATVARVEVDVSPGRRDGLATLEVRGIRATEFPNPISGSDYGGDDGSGCFWALLIVGGLGLALFAASYSGLRRR